MTNEVKLIDHERESLELLFEVGHEVATSQDLQVLLERVLLLSMQNVSAVSGSIIVIDDIGQPAESAFLIIGKAFDKSALQLRITFERGMAGWVARNREAVLILDTSKDERWLHRPDDDLERTGPKSAIAAPIQTSDGLVGVITLVHPVPGYFNRGNLELLQAIADQAGSAIRNANYRKNMQIAHERYQDLFEDNIDPIVITDEQGRILEINTRAEKLFSEKREKLFLQKLKDFIQLDGRQDDFSFENLQAGETTSFETRLMTRKGLESPVRIYVKRLRVNGNDELQWILRATREPGNLNSERDDYIAMVYHDLTSPLTNVASSLESLSRIIEKKEDENLDSLLAIASRSTDRLQQLTNTLLDYYRLESGNGNKDRYPAALESLISEAVEAVQPVVQQKAIPITWYVPEGLPKIRVDSNAIVRVLINLLENAAKFSPTKGKIHISAILADLFVEIAVSDTGEGIAESDKNRIFEKFARLSTKEGPQGLGLGLAFCRLAVEANGGEIWVESEPGKGSTFKFRLPVVRDYVENLEVSE